MVAVGYLAINLFLGNFIEPKLMGRRFGLSTLVVILSLIFWGWLWGPLGMLLAVPLTVIVKIAFTNSEELQWVAVLLGPSPRRAEERVPTQIPMTKKAATRART